MFVRLEEQNVSVYPLRMRQLLDDIKIEYPHINKGLVLLLANFEEERSLFRQESSFYYLTGIQEPSAAVLVDLKGSATLLIPQFGGNRNHWVYSPYALNAGTIKQFGIQEVTGLGDPCSGYQVHPFFSKNDYAYLVQRLEQAIADGFSIFTLNPSTAHGYLHQRFILHRLNEYLPGLLSHVIDISSVVAQMRRCKDMHEIETMYKAANITMMAQEAALEAVGDGVSEHQVQAAIDYVYASSGARHAFPSIVGSGAHSTFLHYTANNGVLKNGDLVVVDIGAEYQYYAADITRTYPVSGTFTARQREIYQLVLDTQEYIASIAKPGYFLSSKKYEDKSLNHLARKYLTERGYGDYFPHNIGHFLGLDVHDVGNYDIPLQEGDVITIEPGIYIPHEQLGVRIEDDYWIVEDGVVCLSQELPKQIDEIEAFMADNKK